MISLEEKKQILSHIVEDADDKLTGLLIAVANEYNTSGEKYSQEEIEEFYRIRDNLLARPETGYTPEQADNLIRNKSKNAI